MRADAHVTPVGSCFAQGAGEEWAIRNDGGPDPACDRSVDVIGQATVLRFVSSVAVFGKTLHIVSLRTILKVKEGVPKFCSYASHGFEAYGSCKLVLIVIEIREGFVISNDVTVIEVKAQYRRLVVKSIGC